MWVLSFSLYVEELRIGFTDVDIISFVEMEVDTRSKNAWEPR